MEDKKIEMKDGKLIIDSQDVLQKVKDQGLEFSDDGSLKIEEGANVTISVSWG